MQLYNLDDKMTSKSYEILNIHVDEQKELDKQRVNEIRTKCRDILERNGIYEDRKNGMIYQNMEKELKNLEGNIGIFNENNLEEITRNKIENGIDNIAAKIECLEDNEEFGLLEDEYQFNRKYSENNVRNLIFNYFENYKANTIDLLLKSGYSQNTIDNIENDILEYSTSKYSDILTEKFTQDGIKNIESLNVELDDLSNNILKEAEIRYNCQVNGEVFDELKEKREVIKQKAKMVEELIFQINSIDAKSNKFKVAQD